MEGERERERVDSTVLVMDQAEGNIYIYMCVYVCVCMCVSTFLNTQLCGCDFLLFGAGAALSVGGLLLLLFLYPGGSALYSSKHNHSFVKENGHNVRLRLPSTIFLTSCRVVWRYSLCVHRSAVIEIGLGISRRGVGLSRRRVRHTSKSGFVKTSER